MAMRCLRPAEAVLGGVLVLGTGCGLRSNALDDFDAAGMLDDAGVSEDSGSGGGEASCAMPKSIPADINGFVLSGSLRGSGNEVGQCGRDDGPEAVWAYTPVAEVDVSLRANPGQSSFVPTVRVERDSCGDPGRPAELCASDLLRTEGGDDRLVPGLARHFLAQPGSTYFITVDSPGGTTGSYHIELEAGPPSIDQCSVHAETIVYAHGGTFSWINEFSAGYGRVSSRCGAPGKENMFRLVVDRPGWVFANAIATGGFVPVLSLRTACSATSELECTSQSGNAIGEWFVEAGDYFLTIDNGATAAGGYELHLDFF